jgi:hypothetical protein
MTAPTTPPNPVVEAGTLTCRNSGIRKLAGLSTSDSPIRLTVGGSPVVTVKAAASAGTYTGCTFTDSNGISHLCNSTKITSPGAGRLTAGGNAVLLSNDTVLSDNPVPAGSGSATVDAGQSKLTAT